MSFKTAFIVKVTFFAFLFFGGFIITNHVFAAPFLPGETLDPPCGPSDVNCTVIITTDPAGSDTQVQFNDSGVFGASSAVTFDGSLFRLPSLRINDAFTFPTTDGTSGQVLQTNGGGAITWETPSTTSPGGSDTYVQFNNSGAFGGSSTLTFNGSVLRAPSFTLNDAFTFPTTDGTSGQVLQTDGGGTVTWETVSASPAGSSGQIQFNNSGAFGASSNLFWDSVNSFLGIGTSSPSVSLETTGSIKQEGSAYTVREEMDNRLTGKHSANMNLSQMLDIDFKLNDAEVQLVSPADDRFPHAFTYAEGWIFMGTRAGSTSCTIYRFDPDTLAYTSQNLPNDGKYENCEKMIYVPQTGKLYIAVFTNTYGTGIPTRVVEMDPQDISDYSLVIEDTSTQGTVGWGASGSITSDGTYLYTADGNAAPYVKKFDMSTWSKVDDIRLTDSGTIHGMETDGVYLYPTTFYGKTQGSFPGKKEGMYKVRTSDMTQVDFLDLTAHALNPQGVIVGDYIYIASEDYVGGSYYANSGKFFRIKKSDLSYDIFELPFTLEGVGWGEVSLYDGQYIYFYTGCESSACPPADVPQFIGRFSPDNLNLEIMLNPTLEGEEEAAGNWLVTDGQRLFSEVYTSDLSNIGVVRLPAFVPDYMKIQYNDDLSIAYTVDYSTGETLFYNSTGTATEDLGDGAAGNILTIGRNDNSTNTAAGSVNFLSKAGTNGYVWQDAAGNMRIHTAAPSNANDTAGTVIGNQTSTRETKQDIEPYGDILDALNKVIDVPLHTFRYINEVVGYGEESPLAKVRLGYVADEVDPLFMWGDAIDQVSVNGLLIGSVQGLNMKLADLEARANFSIEGDSKTLVQFFSDFLEKTFITIRELFVESLSATKAVFERIEAEELCLGKICINEDQLKELLILNNIEYNVSDSKNDSEEEINNKETEKNNERLAVISEETINEEKEDTSAEEEETPQTQNEETISEEKNTEETSFEESELVPETISEDPEEESLENSDKVLTEEDEIISEISPEELKEEVSEHENQNKEITEEEEIQNTEDELEEDLPTESIVEDEAKVNLE